jgi:putative DNA primase/helicase
MGKDYVEFEPTHKLVLMTNARPRLRGSVSASLKRRIFFVPWSAAFEGAGLDTKLKPRLAEPDGLATALNWMVDGYAEFCRIGLAPPRSVLAATADYIADEDTIASFLEDRCLFGADLQVEASEVYKAYKAYCKDHGEQSVARAQDFKPALLAKEAARKGGVTWKRDERARRYIGLALRPLDVSDYEARHSAHRAQRAFDVS